MRLVVSRNGQTKELFATAEHRWFVRSGENRRSDGRSSRGSSGRGSAWCRSSRPIERNDALCVRNCPRHHVRRRHLPGTGSRAELDPIKDARLKWFPHSRVTQRGPHLRVYHLPRCSKSCHRSTSPSPTSTGGWLATSPPTAMSPRTARSCSTARPETLDHVRAVCTRLGIGTYGVTEQVREAGREPSSIFRIHFVNEDLTEEFFLLDQHRIRFSSSPKAFARRGWVVRSVEPTDRVEEVYCAVVEQGHAFVLEDNILTGNCFGCSQGGDAIDFLMKQETLSFTEAVERLAHRAGIELRYEGRSAGERGSMGARAGWWPPMPRRSSSTTGRWSPRRTGAARAYLSSRGIDRAVAERFRLGWAPGRSWDALVGHLRGKGFRPEELTEAGLARTGSRGCATPSTPGCCSRSSTWPATRSPSAGACWTSTRAAGPST